MVLTHLKAFWHQVNRCGQHWSHPDTELRNCSQNHSLCEETRRRSGGSLSLEGSKTCSTAKANPPLTLDVSHEICHPCLPALLGLSVAPFCSCPPLGISLPWLWNPRLPLT